MKMYKVRAYAQLLRIPNVFTALADICLGWLASGGLGKEDWTPFYFLLGSSACLYSAGMVLNDFFDVEVDRKERPFRPIPSGRISRRTAGWLGIGLLAAGLVLAALCPSGDSRAILAAILLASSIVLYDGSLKRYWIGPVGMGTCRFLNVLMGQSAGPNEPWTLPLAATVGIYIVGVTWFARRETETSRRFQLFGATGVMLAAAILGLLLPIWWTLPGHREAQYFPLFLLGWCIVIGLPIAKAISKPEPADVQAAIKRCLMGLVGLDAVLAFAFVGWPALAILLLLLPGLWLGRWVYST
jgi:4-hydroxybenzoate polyprenyltransferase